MEVRLPRGLLEVQPAQQLRPRPQVGGRAPVVEPEVVHQEQGDGGGPPGEFLGAGAGAEMETALRLSLTGLQVAFVPPSDNPSPDLLVSRESHAFNVEVSSLNPPAEQGRVMDLFFQIQQACMFRVASSVVISQPPQPHEVNHLVTLVKDAVDLAIRDNVLQTVNVPGLAIVYVAPREIAGSLPAYEWGHGLIMQPYPRTLEERIGRKVRDKAVATLANGRDGVLVLHGVYEGHEKLLGLFEDPKDDVAAAIASFPKLMALVVRDQTPLVGDSGPGETQQRGNRILIRDVSTVRGSETTVVWRNAHAVTPVPPEMIDAFRDREKLLQALSL